ncbi:DNA-binding protein [Priestia sp. J2]|uniref:DNA-binding protein n=1 Tax=Priestia sp. J2 TaxID=2886505 RepID=UPI001E4B58DE|nr:DNA-binding protein [Priestia sp. J2]
MKDYKLKIKTKEELMDFLANEIVNTAEAAEIIGCSVQNINQRVERGSLIPIRGAKKDKLFLKTDIVQARNNKRRRS